MPASPTANGARSGEMPPSMDYNEGSLELYDGGAATTVPPAQTGGKYEDLFADDESDVNETPLRSATSATRASPSQTRSPLIAQTRPDAEELFEDETSSQEDVVDSPADRGLKVVHPGAPILTPSESSPSSIAQSHISGPLNNVVDDDHVSPNRVHAGDRHERNPASTQAEPDNETDHNNPTTPAVEAGPSSQLLPRQSKPRRRRDSYELYTPTEASRVRRKLDTHLVLFLALLYALSFLDRSNIGNASLAGLRSDLSLSDSQYTLLLRCFYLTYIAFEWMTLLYRIFPAHIYISMCVLGWGIVASLQALVTGFGGLLALRLLLGVAEAAFGPGIPFYLSFFYRREELAYRVGMFIAAAPLASCFASGLAFAIVALGNKSPIASWRLLFLVEGFPSVLVAVWAWRWIPDGPGDAQWLSDRERRVAAMRLRRNGDAEREKEVIEGRRRKGLNWSEIIGTLKDPKSYLTAGMFFSCNVAFSSMPVFEPTIVKSMGYTRAAAQGLSALPHFVAFLDVLLVSRLSDRYRTRSPFVAFVAVCSMFGYVSLAIAPTLGLPPVLKYLCLFPITAGFFAAVTLTIVWTLDNQKSDSSKGTGVAILNIIGQMGPLVGTGLYPRSDGPDYVKGHAVCACFMALVAGLSLALRVVLKRANEKKTHEYQALEDEEDLELKDLDKEDGHETSGHDHSDPGLRPERTRFVYML